MSNYRYSTGVKRPRWGGEKARGENASHGANEPGTGGKSARGRTGKGAKKPDTSYIALQN